MLPVVQIGPFDDISPLVRQMRKVAWEAGVETRPNAGYSATVGEAYRRAAPQAKKLLDRGDVRIVQILPDLSLVSVALSVEAHGERLLWHLSVGVIPGSLGQPPGRASDALVIRLATAFGTLSEGPPKGAFANVRHLYGPCER